MADRELKTVLVSWLAISNDKILVYFSNIYGSNFIKQHSETVIVWNYQNADCSLRKKFIVSFIIILGPLSFPISMRSWVYLTARCLSVRRSVCLSHHGPTALNPLLKPDISCSRAQRAGDIDRLLHGRRSAAAAGKCGQCHVVSVRRTLNTNLFLVDKEPALLQAPYTYIYRREAFWIFTSEGARKSTN